MDPKLIEVHEEAGAIVAMDHQDEIFRQSGGSWQMGNIDGFKAGFHAAFEWLRPLLVCHSKSDGWPDWLR